MANAKQPGGLYFVRGVCVDAEGRRIEDAPALEPDTPAQSFTSTTGPTAAELDALVTAKATEIAAKIVEQKLAELTAPSAPEAPAAGAPQSK